jgi:hypothetical protein
MVAGSEKRSLAHLRGSRNAFPKLKTRDISPTSTQKPRLAVPAILEPYLCRENCSPFHTKSCLLCLPYLYSRPTFPGNGANLCGDTLTVSLHHVKSVVRPFWQRREASQGRHRSRSHTKAPGVRVRCFGVGPFHACSPHCCLHLFCRRAGSTAQPANVSRSSCEEPGYATTDMISDGGTATGGQADTHDCESDQRIMIAVLCRDG